jgi:ADP-ribosylglycohydrolase
MLGAIAGDVIGSVYEGRPIKTTEFPLFQTRSTFTDDTVLTVAVADAILSDSDYATCFKRWGRRYPSAGYGGSFAEWLLSEESRPYDSWGNGAAMRVSPVGLACATPGTVLDEARKTAEVTHNHPEGVKGAQATALAVLLARHGEPKSAIKREIGRRFGYDLNRTLDEIRPEYRFDVSCQGSVPESIIAFLRGRRPQRHLPRRRQRHHGVHRRRDRPGLLPGGTGEHRGGGARAAAGGVPGGNRSVRRQVQGLSRAPESRADRRG